MKINNNKFVDRRLKDGSREDRKFTADCTRNGRRSDKYRDEIENKMAFDFVMVFIYIVLGGILILIFMGKAHAYTQDEAVRAVIGEAEGEPQEGKEAVACAIHNRGTLKGVYGLHALRVINKEYSRKTWENAVVAVEMAEDQEYCESLIHGAQYWEGTAFPVPYWARGMKVTAIIGHQRFFRKD